MPVRLGLTTRTAWEEVRAGWGHFDGVIVSGRADVILDMEDGPTALAILDYKTSTSGEIAGHALQLQVYADAGRREGLDVGPPTCTI